MDNIKSVISEHNSWILPKKETNIEANGIKCNCRYEAECALIGNCLATGVIYYTEVRSVDRPITKRYNGVTTNNFKRHFNNHEKSFLDEKYSNETELSKYVWELKRNDKPFTINWSILKRATQYTGGSARYHLWVEEKLQIWKADKENLLNKIAEIVSKCRHENKFYIENTRHRKNAVTRHPSPETSSFPHTEWYK